MIECRKFKPFPNKCLLGFADFFVEKWGVCIQGCAVYEKEGRRWVNIPAKEYTNDAGEKKFAPFLRFDDEKVWKAFCNQLNEAFNVYTEDNKPVVFSEEKSFELDVDSKSEVPF